MFDRILAKGHFTESEARKVFTQMMRAMNYCHSNGICHRFSIQKIIFNPS